MGEKPSVQFWAALGFSPPLGTTLQGCHQREEEDSRSSARPPCNVTALVLALPRDCGRTHGDT